MKSKPKYFLYYSSLDLFEWGLLTFSTKEEALAAKADMDLESLEQVTLIEGTTLFEYFNEDGARTFS